MVQVTVKDMAGKSAGQVDIPAPDALTAQDYAAVARAIERQRSNSRKPIAHAKTRGEVSGGGKKPWRQKGTGRARAGSIRSPLWTGGGVTWGPRNDRNWTKGLNKRERKRAIRVALQDHALRGTLTLVDGLGFDKPRTKDAVAALVGWGFEKGSKILVVFDNPTEGTIDPIEKSFRNIDRVTVVPARGLNAMLLAHHSQVVLTKGAWDAIQATWFAEQ